MSKIQGGVISSGYSIGLDLIRITAAFLVVGMHLRAALFVDWQQADPKSLFTRFFYFVTSLGSEAVVAFFVLSRFLVGGGILARSGEFAWRPYIASRLCRLWIVLVPALVLAAFLIPFTPYELISGGYRAAWASGPMLGEGSCSPAIWLGNIFFLQKIFIPVFCTDGPLWSLAYEFWYYVLFPLLFIGLKDSRLDYLVLAGILMPFLGFPVLQGFLFWCFGAAASVLSRRISANRSALSIGTYSFFLGIALLLVVSAILFGKSFLSLGNNLFLSSMLLALTFAFLVGVCSPAFIPLSGLRREFLGGFTRRLSESSFSLYVLHFPLICAFVPRFAPSQHASLGFMAIAQFAAILIVCVLISLGFASLTEWRTPEFRRWVMTLWMKTA
jgi:peptidoglycan/LPS O-acetylase OafA/YrhL